MLAGLWSVRLGCVLAFRFAYSQLWAPVSWKAMMVAGFVVAEYLLEALVLTQSPGLSCCCRRCTTLDIHYHALR